MFPHILIILFLSLFSCASPRYYEIVPFQDPVPMETVIVEPIRPSEGLIVIDPGHGGKDLGAHSKQPKYQEKHLTLSTAKMLKTYLEQMGYSIVLTRQNDTFISLEKRAEAANKLDPKLFVSIHFNSAPNTDAKGIEIFYYKSDNDKSRTKSSKKLAEKILTNVIAETKAKSRGVKHGDLSVIRNTEMPAVLVEGGFLTHKDELPLLKDGNYLKRLAWGIAIGIDHYIKSE